VRPNADLPQPVTLRSATLSDLQSVVHLCIAQEIADSGETYTSATSLAAGWKALGLQLATRVWVAEAADGNLLACVELLREGPIFIPRLWVLPTHRDNGLESALLAKAEQRARAIGQEEGAHSVNFFAQATSSHSAAQHALLQSGFVVSSTYEKMERALSEPPASPDVITGIELRSFARERDAEAVYRADEEAFQDQRGHTPRTVEQWSQRLNLYGETYEPSVWFIAWDEEEVAGVALGEIVEHVGWIHHLSVRRPWRRRGLGAALMLSILGSFYQHDIRLARLNVDAQSLTNAHQLYRRLGFRVAGAYSNYEKTVFLM
jgi:mycothiol synthase